MSEVGLIVGNLDAEADWVAASGLPRPGWSKAAAEVASASASVLRVFARPGDTLVLPRRFDVRRMASVPGLPCPSVMAATDSRPRRRKDGDEPHPSVLAWAETTQTAGLRKGRDGGVPRVPAPGPSPVDLSPQAAWRWPTPSPESSRQANDRQFAWHIGRDLGCSLPGDCLVRSIDGWRAAVAAINGPWVAKARFSAAGRWRCWGDARPDAMTEAAIGRLLGRQGVLRVEPWCQRQRDFGVSALATDAAVHRFGTHEVLVDTRGRFQGIRMLAGAPGEAGAATGLSDPHGARLSAVTERVGEALRGVGYRGPFGIDAWLWRSTSAGNGPAGHDESTSDLALHPLGEINARMTFGLVAHALVARLGHAGAVQAGDRVALRFGRLPPGADAWPAVYTLVTPGEHGLAIWLEVDRERSTGPA